MASPKVETPELVMKAVGECAEAFSGGSVLSPACGEIELKLGDPTDGIAEVVIRVDLNKSG